MHKLEMWLIGCVKLNAKIANRILIFLSVVGLLLASFALLTSPLMLLDLVALPFC